MSGLPLLIGEVQDVRGGVNAHAGEWLVFFRHGSPRNLTAPGSRAFRGWGAPLIGSTFAVLNTTPTMFVIELSDLSNRDGQSIPSITFEVSARLDPERGRDELMSILTHSGAGFSNAVITRLKHDFESIVRTRLASLEIDTLRNAGVAQVLFPGASVDLPNALFVVTSVDVTETVWPAWVAVVDENSSAMKVDAVRADEMSREHRFALAQQVLAHELALKQSVYDRALALEDARTRGEIEMAKLDSILARAEVLGVHPLELDSDGNWNHVHGRNRVVLEKLLENRTVLNRFPEIFNTIIGQLNSPGMSSRAPRQADMVLDLVDPDRVHDEVVQRSLDPASTERLLDRKDLTIDPDIEALWTAYGGVGRLMGAAMAFADASCRAILVFSQHVQSLPHAFTSALSKAASGVAPQDFRIISITGTSTSEAINRVIDDSVSRVPGVHSTLTVRTVDNVTEIIVGLSGDVAAARSVASAVNDPRKAWLPAVEALIGNCRIRFVVAKNDGNVR